MKMTELIMYIIKNNLINDSPGIMVVWSRPGYQGSLLYSISLIQMISQSVCLHDKVERNIRSQGIETFSKIKDLIYIKREMQC